jgi:CheY-specific phosphatase CheX
MYESFPSQTTTESFLERDTAHDPRIIKRAKELLHARYQTADYVHTSDERKEKFVNNSWKYSRVFSWYVTLAVCQLHGEMLADLPLEQLKDIRTWMSGGETFLDTEGHVDGLITEDGYLISSRTAITLEYLGTPVDGKSALLAPDIVGMLRAEAIANAMVSDEVTPPWN